MAIRQRERWVDAGEVGGPVTVPVRPRPQAAPRPPARPTAGRAANAGNGRLNGVSSTEGAIATSVAKVAPSPSAADKIIRAKENWEYDAGDDETLPWDEQVSTTSYRDGDTIVHVHTYHDGSVEYDLRPARFRGDEWLAPEDQVHIISYGTDDGYIVQHYDYGDGDHQIFIRRRGEGRGDEWLAPDERVYTQSIGGNSTITHIVQVGNNPPSTSEVCRPGYREVTPLEAIFLPNHRCTNISYGGQLSTLSSALGLLSVGSTAIGFFLPVTPAAPASLALWAAAGYFGTASTVVGGVSDIAYNMEGRQGEADEEAVGVGISMIGTLLGQLLVDSLTPRELDILSALFNAIVIQYGQMADAEDN
ncbi:MAG: hypothetical protein SF123_17155 [Chloroflexota bacterium]|nr:hypothetical protein [Chloroflexota bacterium]